MANPSYHYSVYVGDIHGSRLSVMQSALAALDIKPQRFLCTMDVDQVMSIMDLKKMEREFLAEGKASHIVPGNHEDAIILGIQIGSATFRKNRQDTNIFELTEDMGRPEFEEYRTYVENKLRIKGGCASPSMRTMPVQPC